MARSLWRCAVSLRCAPYSKFLAYWRQLINTFKSDWPRLESTFPSCLTSSYVDSFDGQHRRHVLTAWHQSPFNLPFIICFIWRTSYIHISLYMTHQGEAQVNIVMFMFMTVTGKPVTGDVSWPCFRGHIWQLTLPSMFSHSVLLESQTWKTQDHGQYFDKLSITDVKMLSTLAVAMAAASVLFQYPCRMRSAKVLLCGQPRFGGAPCLSTVTVMHTSLKKMDLNHENNPRVRGTRLAGLLWVWPISSGGIMSYGNRLNIMFDTESSMSEWSFGNRKLLKHQFVSLPGCIEETGYCFCAYRYPFHRL